jgi:hypothetical protein
MTYRSPVIRRGLLCRAPVVVAVVAAAAGLAGCGNSSASTYDPGGYNPGRPSGPATTVSRTYVPTSEPTVSPHQNKVQGHVPAVLVGTWSGGTEGETANTSYTFTADGQVEVRRGNATLDGVAVARGDVLTFYFDGAQPVSSRWAVSKGPEVYGYSYYNLELGGYSYVRDA